MLGRSKLTTWLIPSTSMPRAAMSVATRVATLPFRKPASARSRWPWLLLPWIASAAMPAAASPFTTRSAPCLVRVKTMVRSTPSSPRSFASNAGLPARSTWMTRCVIRSTVVAGGVTLTRAGSRSISSESLTISAGMVAEKNSVWRSFGSLATIRRMSAMKPMSSMRSASSSTSTSTQSRRTAPAFIRSMSRPGVATRMSTPPWSARTWRPIGTPPIASVALRRRWRP